jgi:hypothetical protein
MCLNWATCRACRLSLTNDAAQTQCDQCTPTDRNKQGLRENKPFLSEHVGVWVEANAGSVIEPLPLAGIWQLASSEETEPV